MDINLVTVIIAITQINIDILINIKRQVEEATFRGREFLWWDLRRTGGQPLASQQDQLSLSFKTRHPAGVLFFTGDGKDYVNVALREGGVLVTLDMGGDPLKVTVRPNSVRFDDNQWHTVTVHRTVKEVSVTEGLN
ncbi:neurexin-3-like, partial [Penaeus monodon]|uniref:neurexin-3-like n=1 Tax=Penaeus monodon TaxID=6687 RepID=UPI0018A6E9D6